MDATRSTRLIAVGAAALVVGAALAALAVRGASGAAAAPATAPAATAAVPTEAATPAAPAPRIPETVEVPEGREAVALQVPFDAGVAGLPTAGDRVHVYAVVGTHDGDDTGGPTVEQVLADVEVLAITGPDVAAGGGSPTVVLAVEPGDVDDVVLAQTGERVWLTLTPSTNPEA